MATRRSSSAFRALARRLFPLIPTRTLIGDDEHGWGRMASSTSKAAATPRRSVFRAEAEPEIFATTQRFGTVLENVVLDANRAPDFNDGSLTENTRCAYPLRFHSECIDDR